MLLSEDKHIIQETRIGPLQQPSVEYLLAAARDEAERLEVPLVVERSDRSESVYLHMRRGDAWFGIRVACHEPVYDCSADYLQVLVPALMDTSCRDRAEAYVRRAVGGGGQAVADPGEVEQALAAERLAVAPLRLSAPRECAIRHRLNFRARWTFDEGRG